MFDIKGREFWAVVLGWPITKAFLPSVHDGFESVCHGRSLSGSLFVHHFCSVYEWQCSVINTAPLDPYI